MELSIKNFLLILDIVKSFVDNHQHYGHLPKFNTQPYLLNRVHRSEDYACPAIITALWGIIFFDFLLLTPFFIRSQP